MLKTGFAALCALALLAGCATQSADVYSAEEVGRRVDIDRAVVVQSERVSIDGGENSGYGALLGATAAGVGAHQAGGSDAVAVLAAVIGLGLGYAAEEMVDSREGIRYVLLDEGTGQEYVVIQNTEQDGEPLAPGTPVLVESNGGYIRVIEAPPLAGYERGSWVNPDGTTTHSGTTTYSVPPSPGVAQPGTAEPDVGQPGSAQPGSAQPGSAQPGTAQPDTTANDEAASGGGWSDPDGTARQPESDVWTEPKPADKNAPRT